MKAKKRQDRSYFRSRRHNPTEAGEHQRHGCQIRQDSVRATNRWRSAGRCEACGSGSSTRRGGSSTSTTHCRASGRARAATASSGRWSRRRHGPVCARNDINLASRVGAEEEATLTVPGQSDGAEARAGTGCDVLVCDNVNCCGSAVGSRKGRAGAGVELDGGDLVADRGRAVPEVQHQHDIIKTQADMRRTRSHAKLRRLHCRWG